MRWMAHSRATTCDAPIDVAELSAVERRNDHNDDIDDLEESLKAGRAFEALLSHDLRTRMTLYETRMYGQLSLVMKDFLDLKLARASLLERSPSRYTQRNRPMMGACPIRAKLAPP